MPNGVIGNVARLAAAALSVAVLLLGGSCQGSDKPPPLSHAGTGGGSGAGAVGNDAPDDRPSADQGDGLSANCGEVVCRGHGKCQEKDKVASCVCDEGYKLVNDECVVDEECIKIRFLDDSCRQVFNGPPAVGVFFAVDYCAGTAVLPSALGDLATKFKILEDDIDIKDNPESSATVVPRDVENYVTLALDVSKSLTDNAGLLSNVVAELRTFVRSLQPAAGKPPVGVSVLVFGRFVAEYVPFTTNLQTVDQKLAEIETSPGTVQALVREDGTALYEGVRKGIRATERMQRLRSLVTDAGVLTTGVTVVVTDGRESTNATLDKTLIGQTLVNVISIGVSSDIDDADLTTIGRDGSFLAPTPADMTTAFAEITQRVKQAPDRAYLLAYCSSATTGSPTVTITLNDPEPKQTASCKFNADIFGTGATDVCNLAYFDNACSGRKCSGLLACGACPGDQCCGGDGQCHGPAATAGNCYLQDELCAPDQLVCTKLGSADPSCVPPLEPGSDAGACPGDGNCAPGRTYCENGQCLSVVLNNDEPCEDTMGKPQNTRCPELTCSRINPKNPLELHRCLPMAQMFDACAGTGSSSVCESGTSCRANICQPRRVLASSCAADNECRAGQCGKLSKLCVDTAECFFDWAEKMNL